MQKLSSHDKLVIQRQEAQHHQLQQSLLRYFHVFALQEIDYSDSPMSNHAMTFLDLESFLIVSRALLPGSENDEANRKFLSVVQPPAGRCVTWTDFQIILEMLAQQRFPKRPLEEAKKMFLKGIVANLESIKLKDLPIAVAAAGVGNSRQYRQQHQQGEHGIIMTKDSSNSFVDSCDIDALSSVRPTPTESRNASFSADQDEPGPRREDRKGMGPKNLPSKQQSRERAPPKTGRGGAVVSAAGKRREKTVSGDGELLDVEVEENEMKFHYEYVPLQLTETYEACREFVHNHGMPALGRAIGLPEGCALFNAVPSRSSSSADLNANQEAALPLLSATAANADDGIVQVFPPSPLEFWRSMEGLGKKLFPRSIPVAAQELSYQMFLNQVEKDFRQAQEIVL